MRIYLLKENVDLENWECVDEMRKEIEDYQGHRGGLLYRSKDVQIVDKIIFVPQATIKEDGQTIIENVPKYSIESTQELNHATAMDVTFLH